jgi:uncharacterized alkaline shock family protein YloU
MASCNRRRSIARMYGLVTYAKKKKKHVRSKFLNAGNVGKQVSLQVDNNEKEVLKQQRH